MPCRRMHFETLSIWALAFAKPGNSLSQAARAALNDGEDGLIPAPGSIGTPCARMHRLKARIGSSRDGATGLLEGPQAAIVSAEPSTTRAIAARWPQAGWRFERTSAPARSVRLRLTALYGSLFLLCGAGLLVITYLLVRHTTHQSPPGSLRRFLSAGGQRSIRLPAGAPDLGRVTVALAYQNRADLHQLLIESGIALGVMSLISTALGWLVAGRVLAPIRTMTRRGAFPRTTWASASTCTDRTTKSSCWETRSIS